MPTLWNNRGRKVMVSHNEVSNFARRWPCSGLNTDRAYWFEFETNGDLVDTDMPEHVDGSAAIAMADDCKAWLFDDITPEWAD